MLSDEILGYDKVRQKWYNVAMFQDVVILHPSQ